MPIRAEAFDLPAGFANTNLQDVLEDAKECSFTLVFVKLLFREHGNLKHVFKNIRMKEE